MAKKGKAPARKIREDNEKMAVAKPDSSEEEESEDEYEEIEVEEDDEEEEEQGEDDEDEDEDDDDDEEREEEGSYKRENLRKLLEPFPKDQLIEFVKEAASKNPSILSRIAKTVESDPAQRKIFVHGLGWDATTDQVVSIFKRYGEIEECRVVNDKVTGRCKGYGFVLFKTRRSARTSLKEPQKRIGNRLTSSQLASEGPVQSGQPKGVVSNPRPTMNTEFNPGVYTQNLNQAAGVMLGQNPLIGLANPMLASALNQNGILGIAGSYGVSPAMGLAQQQLVMGGHYGINSVSPSVIGNYSSQFGLQNTGGYGVQLGHSSVGTTSAMAARSQSGFGSAETNFSSKFGR